MNGVGAVCPMAQSIIVPLKKMFISLHHADYVWRWRKKKHDQDGDCL